MTHHQASSEPISHKERALSKARDLDKLLDEATDSEFAKLTGELQALKEMVYGVQNQLYIQGKLSDDMLADLTEMLSLTDELRDKLSSRIDWRTHRHKATDVKDATFDNSGKYADGDRWWKDRLEELEQVLQQFGELDVALASDGSKLTRIIEPFKEKFGVRGFTRVWQIYAIVS